MTQILVTGSNGTIVSADILHGSSFTFEINQPLLDTEHIPVPFSSEISFPPTRKNKELFRYLPAMMTEPGEKKLAAAIMVDGIVIDTGVLVYTGIESGNLQYSFAGKNVEDDWGRKIWNPSDALIQEVVSHAAKDDDFRPYATGYVWFPTMLNKDNENLPFGTADGQSVYRYFNWRPSVNSMVSEQALPAIYIKPIIKQSGNLSLCSKVDYLLSTLAICGQYKVFTQDRVSGKYNILKIPGQVKSTIFGGLPDVSVSDVVKMVAKMTCSSIFRKGAKYLNISAADCLGSEAVDISGKISDIFSASVENRKRYRLSWTGVSDSENIDGTPANYNSLKSLLDATLDSGRELGDLHLVRHSSLKDIYSIRGARYGYTNGPCTAGSFKSQNLDSLDDDSDSSEEFDNSIDAAPVRTIPDYVPTRTGSPSSFTDDSVPRMIPVMEPPSADLQRGSDILLGHVCYYQDRDAGRYLDYQMCDKGLVFKADGTDMNMAASLSVGSLYDRYHSAFASWIGKDRQTVRAELNFTALDLANVKMYGRVKFAGRYWLIKQISATITAGGRLKTEGEFVSV